MKNLKLLLLAICALFGGASQSWAQASFNHAYTVGAEPAAGGDYFLYNIGVGQFLTNGLNYGTRATVDNSGRVLTLAENGTGYSIYTDYVSLNNRTEAKAGYLTTNGFVDTGTNDAAWVFTPVSVAGYTNAYTIKNSDTQYLFFDRDNTDPGCPVNVGNNTGNNYSYWLLIPKASRETAGDYSHYLINTQMNAPWEFKTWGGSTGWNDNAFITPGGNVDNRCGEKYHTVVDIYQDVKETLPNGRYKLYAQGFWRQDGSAAGPVLYANSDTETLLTKTGSENSMSDASTSFSAGNYVNSVETFVSDGSLRVGINITANSQWVIFDNFVLDYLGQCVMDYAVALPDGGAMAADTWYYFDIAVAGDNYNATATPLGDIICVTDGYTLTSAASGTVTLTATDNTLAAQRYYVKSSSANNLVVAPASYTYTVGTATADKSYIQVGDTVTVSYADLVTSDPSASAKIDFSGVTFGGEAITVTRTANGFTFTVPTVTAATDYTLAIPANAIGYAAGSVYNEAQNITLKTPAIYDGTYFLKVANATAAQNKYLARGRNWGTHATLDKYGLPVIIATDANNVTTLQAADTRRYFFHANSWDCYADKDGLSDAAKFTVSLADGKYRIHNNTMAAGTYLKYNDGAVNDETISVFDDGTGSNNGPIIDWLVETPSAHATAMQALKDGQAASSAAAAYASGNYESLNGITTISALEAELTANYIQGDFVAPTTIESVLEKYQGDQPGNANTTETVYSNTIDITNAGFYKFSMQAFYRLGSNANTQTLHASAVDFPPVVLFFGDAQTQIKSVYDESSATKLIDDENSWEYLKYNDAYYPNSMNTSLKAFKAGMYHNDVWVYISTPGTYTYGVKYMGFANGNQQWFIYSPQSVTVTSYAAAATAADYTALNAAITEAEGKTLGFEKDEYAPYNNIAALTALATAKSINQSATNSKLLVQSSIAAMDVWVANAAEVNAVYNGDFALSENDGAMTGWVTDHEAGLGGAYHARAFVLNSGAGNYDNLAAFGQGDGTRSCAYFRFDGTNSAKTTIYTYGQTEGYIMPLKVAYYRLTAQLGGWGQVDKDVTVEVVNADNDVVGTQTVHTPTTGVHAGGATVDVNFVIDIRTAGNYKLRLKNGSSSVDNAMVISNIVLKKAVAEDVTISEDETYEPVLNVANVTFNRTLVAGWNGLVLPFDMTAADVKTTFNASKVKTFDGIEFSEGNGVTLKFADADNIEAGTPFLLKADAGTSYTINNVILPANNLQEVLKADATADNVKYTMKGTYAATTTLDDVNFALIQGDKYFYHTAGVNSSSAKAFRAYFENNSTAPEAARVTFLFDDEVVTGISQIENAAVRMENTIFDLQGRKVEKAVKGLYIRNGKKVVIK